MKTRTTQTAMMIGVGLLALVTGLTVAASRALPHHDAAVPSWQSLIRQVDEKLAANDLGAADRAWHDAYGAALGSRGWEGMIAVGDASLRIGTASLVSGPALDMARQSYLVALFRARAAGSLDGVLRGAEAFNMLGDHVLFAQSLHIATALAARTKEPAARVRLEALATRPDRRVTDIDLF